MNVLITGGTGFIGTELIWSLTRDKHQVTILSRKEHPSKDRYVSYLVWNGKEMPMGIGLYDVVINLAGAPIAGDRWTDARKKIIRDSRINSTRACVNYINNSPKPPQLFLSASAVGYYGMEAEGVLDETGPPGTDFAAEVGQMWEEEALKAKCRTVLARIGIVLGKGGGAMEKMVPIYKMYLGGKFGSGKQGWPWIHIDDIVKSMRFIIDHPEIEGPVNMTGPETIDQATFSRQLAKALGTIDLFTVPGFALKIMFGEQAGLFLGGQHVIPAKLQQHGFEFDFPEVRGALEDLV